MNKKTNKEFYDDGHTVYNMDVDGMPHRNFKNKSDRMQFTATYRFSYIYLGAVFFFLNEAAIVTIKITIAIV